MLIFDGYFTVQNSARIACRFQFVLECNKIQAGGFCERRLTHDSAASHLDGKWLVEDFEETASAHHVCNYYVAKYFFLKIQ